MSRFSRWTIGIFALLSSISSSVFVGDRTATQMFGCNLFALFCLLIAIACFSSALRKPTGRLIVFFVFVVAAWYIVTELQSDHLNFYCGRSNPSIINAIFCMIGFGFPGLYFATRGRYPRWGRGATVFNAKNEADVDTKQEDLIRHE